MGLTEEIIETKKYIDYLETTKRIKLIEQHPETKRCIDLLKHFNPRISADYVASFNIFKEMNDDYKEFREHSLKCLRCQISLDNMFLFKAKRSSSIFPAQIQEILMSGWLNDIGKEDKDLYICKLPAPSAGNFGPSNSRLVYVTSLSLEKAVKEFTDKIQIPLELKDLSPFKIRTKKTMNGTNYYQADTHHKDKTFNTYLSIRSVRV